MVHDFNVGIVMVNSDIRNVFVKSVWCTKILLCDIVLKLECIKMPCVLFLTLICDAKLHYGF